MSVKVASRKSDLARIQAMTVGEKFLEKFPNAEISYSYKESLGDKDQDTDLTQMPAQGVFTKDFRDDLVFGRQDMVVHSWKDLPTEELEDTEISATLPRADMRDLLLVKKSSVDRIRSTKKITVLSSSPRREYNLSPFLPEALPYEIDFVAFKAIRGNVPTRFSKLIADEEADALVIAKAAWDRLMSYQKDEFKEMQENLRDLLSQTHWMVLPLTVNPCAAAQGALAVETRKDRVELKNRLEEISCAETMNAVVQERNLLSSFGGGCHQKIGISILNREYGQIGVMRGLTEDGQEINKRELNRVKKLNWTKVDKSQVYPLVPGESPVFDRNQLQVNVSKLSGKALWVARENGLPDEYVPHEGQIVWCAGLQSWKKLAARGVWVHGCAESLGENEDQRIDQLVTEKQDWVKLTHVGGIGKNKFPTYQLTPKLDAPDLSTKTHFYWMSFSQFQWALQKHPQIINGYHGCGPGHTHQMIRAQLGPSGKIGIFLSHADFLKEVVNG